jgi:hypothetical protein
MTKYQDPDLHPDPLVRGHGSADLDPDPDPYQNVMDPQHCFKGCHDSLEDEYERGDESRPESQAYQSESHLGNAHFNKTPAKETFLNLY